MPTRDPGDAAPFIQAVCRAVTATTGLQAVVSFDDDAVPRGRWPAPGSVLVVEDHPARVLFGESGFVAGVPIVPDGGEAVGVLWVAGVAPSADLDAQLTAFAHLIAIHVALQADSALYRIVAENSADTLIRGSLDGIRRYVSPSIRSLLGYEADELVGRRARDITHPDDLEDFGAQMAAMADARIDSFTTEHRMRHKDGTWVWIEAFVKVTRDAATGSRDGYVVSVRNTSRRKELEMQLAHSATHDTLTGLPNRALLGERLRLESERCVTEHDGFAVLSVDLDGFKKVNDEFGHEIGDAVLVAVSDRLTACAQPSDTVARRGGDEFVVVHVTDAPLRQSAVALAQRMIEASAAPMTVPGWCGTIGLSVGVAIHSGPAADAELLLRAADRAMYDAKASGRNGYRVVEPTVGHDGEAAALA